MFLILRIEVKQEVPACLILLSLLTANISLMAQQDRSEHAGDHHHKHHEMAIGTGLVWLPEESSTGYGIHLHGNIGITEWMGIGPGYELIVGRHTHHTLSGLLHFHPIHPLDINVGPGLVFPDEETAGYRFKLHSEIAAVFELGEHIHLGPSIDAGVGKKDLHITFGIHLGYVFH